MADTRSSRCAGPGDPVLDRVTRAAVVGGVLAFVCVLGALVTASMVPCRAEGWDCLGTFLLAGLCALVLTAVSAWPVLHVMRVRPALPVALCGPLVTGAIVSFGVRVPMSAGIAWSGWFVEATLGYGVAAFVTTGAVRRRWRALAVVLVVVLVPLGGWINGR